MKDVFISHAKKDLPLVDAFVQLIEGGIGFNSDQIFCSSIEEQGIPPGVDFKTHIKSELAQVKVVISLVSLHYYSSAFCMCELGATWALSKTFVPLLVPPVDYNDLRGSLFGTQSLVITDEKKLDAMHSALESFAARKEPVVRWNSRKHQFLQQLPQILRALPPIKVLSEQECEQLKAQVSEYKSEYERVDAANAQLNRKIAEISKLKDARAVAQVEQRYSSDWENFEELISAVQATTANIPRVVKEALYYRIRGQEFYPNRDDWGDEPLQANEEKLLRTDEAEFWPNENHPKIKRALAALQELRRFFEEPPEGFAEQYEQKYDDVFEIGSRPLWQRHNLL